MHKGEDGTWLPDNDEYFDYDGWMKAQEAEVLGADNVHFYFESPEADPSLNEDNKERSLKTALWEYYMEHEGATHFAEVNRHKFIHKKTETKAS